MPPVPFHPHPCPDPVATFIARLVAEAPPLSAEQRAVIASLGSRAARKRAAS